MPWDKSFNIDDKLREAMEIFWTYGYKATSMQNLVTAIGLNRGSIYDTYGSKRDLFISALNLYDTQYRKAMFDKFRASNRPIETLRKLCDIKIAEALDDDLNRGCFLTNTALELSSHDDVISEIVSNSQLDIEDFFHELIVKGQAQNEIPDHIDPVKTSQHMLATFIGFAVLSKSRPEKELLEGIAEQLMQCIN